jgi:hypothetical protein
MVTITNAILRETKEYGTFVSIELTQPMVPQKSKSGNIYFVDRKTNVAYNGDINAIVVGSKLPGKIEKIKCEPREVVLKSGDKVTLDFNYVYNPEE